MKRTEFTSSLLGERFTRVTHPSGLTVLIFPKKMSTVHTLFAVNYGSLDVSLPDGTPIPDGTAHFLEHKLFEDENGEDAFAAFSAYGADVNAYTSFGRTAYLFSTTAHFSECLTELLHFVTDPHFTDASVARERGIIAQEIKMYEDQPWERVYQNMLGALYRAHPVRRNICGTLSTIKKITPDVLGTAYAAYYRLSNMALVVCGDVDEGQVLSLVDEAFGEVSPAPALPKRKETREEGGAYRSRVSAKMQVAKPIFCIGIKDRACVPEGEDVRHELAMSLLCEILFSQSGSFFEELLDAELVGSLSWEYSTVEGARFVCLSGESDDPEEVLSRLYAFLDKTQEKGIDPEDFERCRRARYAGKILSYDSTEEIAGALLDYVAFDGEALFEIPEMLMKITREELEALLESLCQKENFAISTVTPMETEKGS